jgi:CRP-like cAMP-binding protein
MLRSIRWLRVAADLDVDLHAHAETADAGQLIASIPVQSSITKMWVVVSGSLEVLGRGEDDSRRRINTLGRGDFFFDRQWSWGRLPAVEVRAAEKTTVLVLPHSGLLKLVKLSRETRKEIKGRSLRMAVRARAMEKAAAEAAHGLSVAELSLVGRLSPPDDDETS